MTGEKSVERTATVRGEAVHFSVAGAGPALLLLHGWPTDSALWRDHLAALAVRHRVHAPDRPGFGRSGRPGVTGHTVGFLADAVIEFLDELGVERASRVGHDLGAAVALAAITGHPERCDRLVICSSALFAKLPWLITTLLWTAKAPILWRSVVSRVGFRTLFRVGLHRRRVNAPAMADRYYDAHASTVARHRARRDVLTATSTAAAEVVAALARVEHPTLVLWGERDPNAPLTEAHRLVELLSNAELAPVAGAGHFLTHDRPEAVTTALVDYLAPAATGDNS